MSFPILPCSPSTLFSLFPVLACKLSALSLDFSLLNGDTSGSSSLNCHRILLLPDCLTNNAADPDSTGKHNLTSGPASPTSPAGHTSPASPASTTSSASSTASTTTGQTSTRRSSPVVPVSHGWERKCGERHRLEIAFYPPLT